MSSPLGNEPSEYASMKGLKFSCPAIDVSVQAIVALIASANRKAISLLLPSLGLDERSSVSLFSSIAARIGTVPAGSVSALRSILQRVTPLSRRSFSYLI